MSERPPNDPAVLTAFSAVAAGFWRTNAARDPGRVILVEAMSQDLRVTLRNLSVANALSRVEPADIIVYSGTDAGWNEVVWSYFDLDRITQLAHAYGAREVFDVHRTVDRRVRTESFLQVVGGVDLGGDLPESGIDQRRFEDVVDATTCRMAKVARLDGSPQLLARRSQVRERSREFARVYDALIGGLEVVAVVSSHVDYDNFGLAVEAALRHDVPVLFPQSTGGSKVYALFPERHDPTAPVRAGLTQELGAFFESHIWDRRDLLQPGAELTTYRSKATLGRPSWWRPGRSFSSIELRGPQDRAAVRRLAGDRVGLDPAKPTVTVFNHAVSDALGTNVEAYPDLGAWFEHTADLAATRDEVNWLFLDHPSQELYDSSASFDGVAAAYADRDHMRFLRSMELSKNMLLSLTDLALTVRGSVSNEYPALGVPAIQTGWSEWSACGFTTTVDTPEEHAKVLDDHIGGLLAGERLISPDQVERARLWTWFYRAGTDVASGLVPPWALGQGNQLFETLTVVMLHVESDADPLFTAVRRLWKRRDPVMTRVDLTTDTDTLADSLGVER